LLIDQLTITPQPQYNFSHINFQAAFPQRFTELSFNTLKHAPNQTLLTIPCEQHTIPLTPKQEETLVTAVDTSNIKIGETHTGALIAVRSACVWKQSTKYSYQRFGPFVFHVTEKNKGEVYTELKNTTFNTFTLSQYSPDISQIPTYLTSLLERSVQTVLAKQIISGLLLFDGSLTAGTIDAPAPLLTKMLNIAHNRGNVVLAFSKMTKLRLNNLKITDNLPQEPPPYICPISLEKSTRSPICLGDIYVAKFTTGRLAFRLDIPKVITLTEKIEAVEKLLGNDQFFLGYPETLRLAHIFCTFTANEVIAIQHFVTTRYGIELVHRPDMHRLLFGSFGKGEKT
jgi:hypothetical protein